MKDGMQPLLTIGMIFKNDIRCLERCLKALEPLREAVTCELVMADTGSADGSREVAARYADILFDFPWIDDFSAARNAVMDRASGKWYLTIDSDEYLDEDISELVALLKSTEIYQKKVCSIVQRNYDSYEMNGIYTDFSAIRLLYMSTGLRYEGIIHERWPLTPEQLLKVHPLLRTIVHHDGYADSDSKQIAIKRKRNIKLLKRTLDKEPGNMTTLLQYVESSRLEPNHPEIIRRAVTAIENKQNGWQILGAPILRHAVRAARERNLPELQEWIKQAETKFPHSFFTMIDVEYIAFSYDWDQEDYTSCIRRGEDCLKALAIYRDGGGNQRELLYSSLLMSAPYWEQGLKIFLADSYLREGNSWQCRKYLEKLDWSLMDGTQTENFIRVIRELHSMSLEDTEPLLMSFWDSICHPLSPSHNTQICRDAFYNAAALAFSAQSQKEEKGKGQFCRLSYTLFIPLKNKCDIGRGAAVLNSEDAEEIYRILAEVKKWGHFPPEALSHALAYGIAFPLEGYPLKIEEMDVLAGRMISDKENFYHLLLHTAKQDFSGNLQKTAWLRSLALAAVQTFDWVDNAEDNIDTGMELARLFARIEETFISDYYQPEMLHSENLCLLPPLHRLGWYCARAFKELDNGNTTEYIRSLRAGLNSCQEGKAMISFLTEHTPQLQQKEVSPELKALAEQIRKILSAYPADAPEIIALKTSPVYQQVAWLIKDR